MRSVLLVFAAALSSGGAAKCLLNGKQKERPSMDCGGACIRCSNTSGMGLSCIGKKCAAQDGPKSGGFCLGAGCIAGSGGKTGIGGVCYGKDCTSGNGGKGGGECSAGIKSTACHPGCGGLHGTFSKPVIVRDFWWRMLKKALDCGNEAVDALRLSSVFQSIAHSQDSFQRFDKFVEDLDDLLRELVGMDIWAYGHVGI